MNIKTENGNFEIDNFPDTCPICHRGIETKVIGSNFTDIDNFPKRTCLELIFRCPRIKCQEAFIGYYRKYTDNHANEKGDYYLRSVSPYYPEEPLIIAEIKDISPSFIKIYNQSHAAEKYGLDQICGVGYRKALEYLIKDYLIHIYSKKGKEILEKYLGNCINDYIDDIKVKECAKRATWLGNDETHYLRKWIEKDIEDLKILLELTSGWIKSNVLTKKYLDDMKGK